MPWSLRPGRDAEMAAIDDRARSRRLPPLRWPQGWPDASYSLLPLRAAVFAERHGRLKPFTLSAFRLMFVEGRALDDADAVLEAARNAGLDAEATAAALDDGDVKARLREYTEAAIARGVTGIPTVAVGEDLFWGDDRLEAAVAAAHR